MAEEAIINRVLPHSIEAEQSVIGSMIMDKDAIVVASEILHGDDFYSKQYGIIFEAKREYDNINDIWASGVDIAPDGTFYIVYPDGGGGGVGLIGAKNFSGPWENPIPGNKKLINNWGGGLADCDGIGWCFDPAIYFDTDGSGYFTFGGGSSASRPAAENNNNIFNIYKFNSDMKGFDINSKVQLKIGGPKAMEASYIHKKGSLYYLSYSTTDLRIAYGTSTNEIGRASCRERV